TQAIADADAARAAAKTYGLPLALKASGGGGGKGLKVAHTMEAIEAAFTTAQREAHAYFNNGTIYAERYLENPKHIELQVLADKFGNVVHVGERDCSLQRRHQKLLEEAPAGISPRVRDGLRDAGIKAAKAIAYDSVGTIECLVAGDDFYFLEMNTRIQVEHTVSEMISGLDLIREQIRVAAGERLGYDQDAIVFRGFAIEGRVNAEDPADNFRPAPGTLTQYKEPSGLGVRVDSAAYPGYTISAEYDSMIAKLIVWAPTRDEALARLRRAIDEFTVGGVPTTLPLLRALTGNEHVKDGSYGTATLEQFAATSFTAPSNGASIACPLAKDDPSEAIRVEVNGKLYSVRVLDLPPGLRTAGPGSGGAGRFAPRRAAARKTNLAAGNDVRSPMHGVVVELAVGTGDTVNTGQVVAVIEAMKMMNEVRAHKDGTVARVHATQGETVEAQAPLVTIE
ncbi:MAG: carbamoyl phosphate synthase, partial [Candidatus Eremiobacteraeota bacterium]|nr:carbamoyl phosphate synthase [Candidatus Eremiobacteraeota bacterium]